MIGSAEPASRRSEQSDGLCRSAFSTRRQITPLRLFEPVMGIWLIIEWRDFIVTGAAIQCLRFSEGPIGLEPQRRGAQSERKAFQGFEYASTYAQSSRIGADPHALYFANVP